MMAMKRFGHSIGLVGVVIWGMRVTSAAVPGVIQHEGVVIHQGTPYSGTGWFKFSLVDAEGATTYWSSDGTGVRGRPPDGHLELSVEDGAYAVLLGPTSPDFTGRPPKTPNPLRPVFEQHDEVYIRVWFMPKPAEGPKQGKQKKNDGKEGREQTEFRLLQPDTRIAAGAYAMVAGGVAEGAIDGAALHPDLKIGGESTAGTVAVLDAAGHETVQLNGQHTRGGGHLSLHSGGGTSTIELVARDPDAPSGPAADPQVRAAARKVDPTPISEPAAAQLFLRQSNGSTTVEVSSRDADGDGGVLRLADAEGRSTVELSAKFAADGSWQRPGAALKLATSDAVFTAELMGADVDGMSKLTLHAPNQEHRATLKSGNNEAGASLELHNKDAGISMVLTGDGGEGQGQLILRHANSQNRVILDGDGANNGGDLEIFDGEGNRTIYARGDRGATGGGILELSRTDGETTIILDAEANGEGKIIADVIQLTGGSDLAEPFHIRDQGTPAEPGMIACIDPDHPGRLRLSDQAYDATVAGVISGAGGVQPGLVMSQPQTLATGEVPVALTGRVYCRVDADWGPIRPGDLITTSATPGHGMRADPKRAAGAIVGKAMTGLDRGQGLVLVLVSLQ
jgi:hypothetical protein